MSLVAEGSGSNKEGQRRNAKKRRKRRRREHSVAKPDCARKWSGKAADMHSFETVSSDHAETPSAAYQDLAPMLFSLAQSLNKTRETLAVYDPYYCDGGVKRRLRAFGYCNVTNENRDFYRDLESESIPPHDVLVTNPPYSEPHLTRIVEHCASSGKPFALLMPSFVLGRPTWSNVAARLVPTPAYVCPNRRYHYVPPKWAKGVAASSSTSPFGSFWYVWSPDASLLRDVAYDQRRVSVFATIDAVPSGLRDVTDPKKRRPNPKARQRLAAKKRRLAAQYDSKLSDPPIV